ncbi:MAG: ribosome maturation factor RimP [Endomicrobiales bacterium]|nr:ribosome maturation factor RimP [Endomicrobiales bacterium]
MNRLEEIEKTITPILEQEKMELVDLQYAGESGRKVLRVFIDKEGGVRLDDCERMSSVIGAVLDKSDPITEPYVLEVSSPGLDRVLKKEKDFVKFKGKKARISLFAPVDGQRNFSGPILEAGGGKIKIDDVTGKTVELELDRIARARLEPEI